MMRFTILRALILLATLVASGNLSAKGTRDPQTSPGYIIVVRDSTLIPKVVAQIRNLGLGIDDVALNLIFMHHELPLRRINQIGAIEGVQRIVRDRPIKFEGEQNGTLINEACSQYQKNDTGLKFI